jgi:lantibiotic leader peptide-processing serine protease
MPTRPLGLSVCLGLALTVVASATGGASDQPSQTFIVLYQGSSIPSNAAETIAGAGGTLVHAYAPIGVAIASSSDTSFAENMRTAARVEGVSETGSFGVAPSAILAGKPTSLPSNAPVTDTDPLVPQQWNNRQIHAPEAHAITGGSPSVTVGDIDTGLDYTHPDLAANVDFAKSVSCLGGVPDTNPAAWADVSGHGTHTAGTIAAASNGVGIVGVAPNVRIAGIKAGNDSGFFFPEAVVCAFMWAAERQIPIVNNSYFADPWLFNCRNDKTQHAIWKAEQRAIQYAISKGVTVVASAGNQWQDLSKANIDAISPDDTVPQTREVTNACVVVPTEVAGVIGVGSTGNLLLKSFYSNYGVGVLDITAPGGDARYQRTQEAPNGAVLSTYPGNNYAYLQGTSMAGPHVAGVAALVVSQFGLMSPGRLSAWLTSTADPIACPMAPYDPGGLGTYAATCVGGTSSNGFYGSGQVNALSAVTAAR